MVVFRRGKIREPRSEGEARENMAEYGIVLQIEGITGNCALKGYEKGILAEAVGFGSSSSRSGYGIKDRRISIDSRRSA